MDVKSICPVLACVLVATNIGLSAQAGPKVTRPKQHLRIFEQNPIVLKSMLSIVNGVKDDTEPEQEAEKPEQGLGNVSIMSASSRSEPSGIGTNPLVSDVSKETPHEPIIRDVPSEATPAPTVPAVPAEAPPEPNPPVPREAPPEPNPAVPREATPEPTKSDVSREATLEPTKSDVSRESPPEPTIPAVSRDTPPEPVSREAPPEPVSREAPLEPIKSDVSREEPPEPVLKEAPLEPIKSDVSSDTPPEPITGANPAIPIETPPEPVGRLFDLESIREAAASQLQVLTQELSTARHELAETRMLAFDALKSSRNTVAALLSHVAGERKVANSAAKTESPSLLTDGTSTDLSLAELTKLQADLERARAETDDARRVAREAFADADALRRQVHGEVLKPVMKNPLLDTLDVFPDEEKLKGKFTRDEN
eukprot:TRINITY_DN4142_c0_g1_i1.p1 TRINITY_DN4142_c0_g1~~TRINITY_DN4142_c0_g1_i1.p1  ORF type:complete len:425 (+),score=50.29 TRINITY_DN4142_c0_g1_i1:251-1525(+)